MRARRPVFLALLALIVAVALVRRRRPADPPSEEGLENLIEEPLDHPPDATAEPGPLWRVLLERCGERGPEGTHLRLGRVLADPSLARASSESAGELLGLEADGPQGKLGR